MVKIAKITNRYGKTRLVPLWRAKKMLVNDEIDSYDTIEVEKARNIEQPQTQRDFERSMNGTSDNSADLKKQNEELIQALLQAEKDKQELARLKAEKASKEKDTDKTGVQTSNNIELVRDDYKKITGKDVPNNKKNDLVWMSEKIRETVSGEIKIPETAPKKTPTLN